MIIPTPIDKIVFRKAIEKMAPESIFKKDTFKDIVNKNTFSGTPDVINNEKSTDSLILGLALISLAAFAIYMIHLSQKENTLHLKLKEEQ